MVGNPKFKVGDKVSFNLNGQKKVGTVYIVDKWGTFFDDSDASYDILVEEENCLYKHINERGVQDERQDN